MSTITAVPAIVYIADCMACHRALDARFISAGCCNEEYHPAELCPSCLLDQPAGSITVEWHAMDAAVFMAALRVEFWSQPRKPRRSLRMLALAYSLQLSEGLPEGLARVVARRLADCVARDASCEACGNPRYSKECWRACTPIEDKLAAYHADCAFEAQCDDYADSAAPSDLLRGLAEGAKAIGNDHLAQQLLDDAAVFGEHDPTPADNADFFGQFEA